MPTDLVRLMHSLFLPGVDEFRESRWRPSADVYRTAQGWLIKFDLAGVRPEDVTLAACGRRLTVAGCRRDLIAEQGHRHYSLEISYSCFERALELPFDPDPARMTTESRDGMLLIWIPTETPT